jgi:acyl carrier protein
MSNYTEEEIVERFNTVICGQLDVDPSQLKPEAALIDDLKADSLTLVELELAMEQEFTIDIPEEDAANIVTVKDLLDYVIAHA